MELSLFFSILCIILISTIECERPTGCGAGNVYTQVDCDEDGILDHACRSDHTTVNDNHWLILSSEGCPKSWGSSTRSISECPAAWPNKGKLSQITLYCQELFLLETVVLSHIHDTPSFEPDLHCLSFQFNVLQKIQIMP